MAEIRQILGFDVAEALINLRSLETRIDSVNGAIDRLGSTSERFNRAGDRFSRSGRRAADTNERLARSTRETDAAFGRLTTSTELLSRILFTQLVIRGLRRTIDAFKQATEAAAELQLKIAEVSTIDPTGVFGGQPGLAAATSEISAAFGIDQVQVASGLYQTLSNQIQGSREQLIEFNEASARFAIGGFIEQETAINLLSGSLQAFGIDVGRTDEIASKFQKTIELGRTTAAELGNSFGTVAPLAAQLGVDINELDAAFATLTINGIKTNVAATQLRGIFTALIKPSDDLKRVLGELGFTSGESAIAALGLDGTLKELVDSTDGSTSAIAKLFPRVRGLSGALVLGAQDAERFSENIERIRETSSDLNQERFDIVFGTDAKQVEQDINELKIALTEAGTAFLRLQRQALDFVGGGEQLADLLRAFTPLFAGLITSAGAFFGGTLLVGITAVAGPLGLLVAGIGSLVAVLNLANAALEESALREFEALQQQNIRELENFKRAEERRLQAARETDEARIRASSEATREIIRNFNLQADALRNREREIREETESTLKDIVGLKQDLVNELANTVSESNEQVRSSQQRVRDLQLDQDDREFDFRLEGRDERQQFAATRDRAVRLARQAGSALRNAINADQINQALDLFRRARTLGASADSIADRTENRQLEAQAAELLSNITEKQIRAERELQRIQQERAAVAEAQRKESEAELKQLQSITKTLLENTSILEDVENQSPEAIRRAEAAREKAFRELQQLAVNSDDLDLSQALGLVDLSTRIQNGLDEQDFEIKLRANLDELNNLPNRLQQLVQSSIAQRPELQLLHEQRVSEGLAPFQSLTEAQNELIATKNRADELRAALSNFDLTREVLDQNREGIELLGVQIQGTLSRLDLPDDVAGSARSLAEELERLSSVRVSDLDVVEFVEDLSALRSETRQGLREGLFPDEFISTVITPLVRAQQALQDLKSTQSALETDEEASLQESLRQAESVLNLSPQFSSNLQAGADALAGQGVSASSQIAQNALRTRDALVSGAQALASASNPRLNPQANSTGGFIFRQDGGFTPRGTDTVPALLTPGEFVMNRKATERHLSAFNAINAGLNPQFRESGGSVTQTGDVTVNVNESSSPKQTAREIVSLLNREFRRGTSKLRT